MSRNVAILLTTWLAVATSGLAAQEPLAHAKELYASAAYDEALAALDLLASNGSSNDATEVGEYRVFCLLALGRTEDANRAIETLVAAHPLYKLSEAQASPRVRAVFEDVRRRLLPQIVQRSYNEAKAAFDRKDLKEAAMAFDGVIALLDDEAVKDLPGRTDFRTLAIGFRDFSRAAAPAPAAASQGAAPASGPPSAPAPRPTTTPPRATPPNQTPPGATTAVPPARTPAPPERVIYTKDDPTVVPPVVVSETIPPWKYLPRYREAQEYQGVLEVVIDENGSVESAIVRQGVHPSYDPTLLRAARLWKFRPATKDGVPVKYRRQVEIRARPTP